MSRAPLIVLEGIDGAGTSTQTASLANYLVTRDRRVHVTREPSDRRVGQLIRSLLGKDSEQIDRRALALLFAADRIDHLTAEVEPALQAGVVVISDRYLWSSLVYQSLALSYNEVAALNRYAPPAALTLLLALPAEIAADRRTRRGGPEEIFDDFSVQQSLAEGYEQELVRAVARGENVRRIDATPSIAEVAAAIASAVDSFLDS